MPSINFILKRFGLDSDANERDIRRAYARQLKQIDLEADPGAFQALHEAYQAALSWAQSNIRVQDAPEETDESAPTQSQPETAHTDAADGEPQTQLIFPMDEARQVFAE